MIIHSSIFFENRAPYLKKSDDCAGALLSITIGYLTETSKIQLNRRLFKLSDQNKLTKFIYDYISKCLKNTLNKTLTNKQICINNASSDVYAYVTQNVKRAEAKFKYITWSLYWAFNWNIVNIQGGPKTGALFLYALTLYASTASNIDRYLKLLFTIWIRRKFVIILSLTIPPHRKCVATLPCEI